MAEMLARPAGLEPATPSLEGLGLHLRSAEVCGPTDHSYENSTGTKGLATRNAPELHRAICPGLENPSHESPKTPQSAEFCGLEHAQDAMFATCSTGRDGTRTGTQIYHGTPLTPRAALKALLPGRGACVSFYRPDDLEAVEAVCPTIMFRQWCLLRVDGRNARRERVVYPRRLDALLSMAGGAAVRARAMGDPARRAGCTFPAQRQPIERVAIWTVARRSGMAHGWAARAPWPTLRALRSRGARLDRTPQGSASRMPCLSRTNGRGGQAIRQPLASNPYAARDQGRAGLPLLERRQHVACAERTPL